MAKPLHGFPKANHLRKTDEISSVFSFRCRVSGERFQVLAKPNQLGLARLGAVASKKVARRAASRNYMRRVVREVFRLQQHQLGCLDIVVRVQKEFFRKDFVLAQNELLNLFSSLQKCRDSSSP